MKRSAGFFRLGSILTLSLFVHAQQHISHEGMRTSFANPDGTFRFSYSESLVQCRRDPGQTDSWLPIESCEAYTPVCSNVSCDSSETLACVAYPAGKLKNTSFRAAAFSVNELKKAATEADCLKVEEPPPHVGKAHTETVNGVRFSVVESDGVGTGNLIDGYVYRTFHQAKCYELDIRIAYSNRANAHPPMKDFDLIAVHRELKRVLDTFKLLN